VSVVVVVYNMPREAPRTLRSLSADYQRHIDADDYEVIVVDNGSNPPFDPRELDHLSGNFRLIRIDPAPPSPARAINRGLAEARGDIIGVMVDGARIVTPGLLHFARHGASLYDRAVVAALGWYLGNDLQRFSMQYGYDQAREDALRNLARRVELPVLTSFVQALVHADRMGTPLGKVLRILSTQLRVERTQRAEKLANQAPVKLLVPLVLCIFPTLFLMLFGPLAYQLFFEGTF